MVKSDTQLYKFGKFQVDTIKRVLLRNDTPVQLPSRAFDVLLALVEHNQYVIDKDELMHLVWGERVVEENNLTRHISTLRKVLDESPNDHRYIVTVPGRGYSFVAPVERVAAGVDSVSRENGGVSTLHIEDRRAKQNGADGAAQEDLLVRTGAAAISTNPLVPPATVKRHHWLWATVLVVGLGGALVGFKLIDFRSRHGVSTYRDWEVVRLTRTGGSVGPDISRDGKYVAYINNDSGQTSVWILQLATSARQQLIPPGRFFYDAVRFARDGSELYFTRRDEAGLPLRSLYRIPVLGGVAKKLRDDIYSPIEISPDGDHLAFALRNAEGKTEFILADADGVEERLLVGHGLESPVWSPDGKTLAFSVGNASGGGESMSVHQIRLDDGAEREISARKWAFVGNKSWLPDGSGLIVSARQQKANINQLWFVPYPSGEARPLSNDFDSFNASRLTQDAGMLVTQQLEPVSDIWRGSLADMGDANKIGAGGREGLSLMREGRILYSAPLSEQTSEISMLNADATERKQLTANRSNDLSPLASPDGRYVVFTSDRSGNFEIWRMDMDGSNPLRLTNSAGANMPSISPDGKWVLYLSSTDGKIRRVPLEGGESVELVGDAVGVSAVSPDGKLVAYFAWVKNVWGIAVSSFEDGSLVRRFDLSSQSLNNRALKWTPDGKAIVYAAMSDGVGNIWMQPLDGGPSKRVTNFKADGIFHFDISTDGKDLVCARGGWKHDIVLIKNLLR